MSELTKDDLEEMRSIALAAKQSGFARVEVSPDVALELLSAANRLAAIEAASGLTETQIALITGGQTLLHIHGAHDCVAAIEAMRLSYDSLALRLAERQAFKDWVHAYLDTHGVPHHPPGTHGAAGCRIGDRMDWLMARLAEAEAENTRLRQRLLTAAGDDLCRLTQEEIKAYTNGEVPIPPREEFIKSCERFWRQTADKAGVNHGCLTLAQLVAENEQLSSRLEEAERERDALRETLEAARYPYRTGMP